jgi:hypothetical protein
LRNKATERNKEIVVKRHFEAGKNLKTKETSLVAVRDTNRVGLLLRILMCCGQDHGEEGRLLHGQRLLQRKTKPD